MTTAPSGSKMRVAVALGVAIVFWASAFVAIKSAVQVYGPGELATLRFCVAVCALSVAGLIKGVRRPRGREILWFALTGLLGIAIYHPFLNYGETVVSAGTASLLISATPVWTAILAVYVLQEKMTWRKAAGIGLSIAGVALLATGGTGISIQPAALFIVCCSLCHATFVVVQKKFLSRFGALEFTLWTMLAGVLWMLPVFGVATVRRLMEGHVQATCEVVYLGIFPAAVAYMAFAYATVRMPASRVMTFLCLSPTLTMVMSWAYIGEVPAVLSLVGGALAIAGVVIVNTARKETGPVVAIEEG